MSLCRNGLHDMTPANTMDPGYAKGQRCRACFTEAQRRYYTTPRGQAKRAARVQEWRRLHPLEDILSQINSDSARRGNR